MTSLRARLSRTRHDRFVGRDREREHFAGLLCGDSLPCHVLHLHGPGGIGKTALLDEYRWLCEAAGIPVGRIDGRDLDPTPAEVTRAVDAVLGDPEAGRRVLLVDTYEALAPLDDWFRRSFVPDLSENTLVVFAGRHTPALEWRAEWGDEVRVEALGALAPDESEAFLDGLGVPPEVRPSVLAFTRGHPLALALAADRYRQRAEAEEPGAYRAADMPDVVAALLSRFVASVPSAAHQTGLEGASVVRSLTEPLLAALLGDEGRQAHDLLDWLRGFSFAEADRDGLRLHDLVREVIEADLRWRDPARFDVLQGRARRYYTDQLRAPLSDADRRRVLSDYVHLYRDNPMVRPLLDQLREAWSAADLEGSGPMEPSEAEAVRALVARHEGSASAEAVGHWLDTCPETVEVFRSVGGGVAGFLLTVRLDAVTEVDRQADPVIRAAWDAVGARLRAGERSLYFRSWMDAEAHQGISAVQSLVFARTVQLYLTTPDLAVSLLACTTPDLWEPVFHFAGLRRWPEADVEAEGVQTAVFGKDWRSMSPAAWLDALAERAPAQGSSPPALVEGPGAFEALSEEHFAEAVRESLKAYARPHRLEDNPLVRSRVVRANVGEEGPVEALLAILAEAASELRSGPRDAPYFRALDITYLRPAPTQAIAAERLGLPFSTYRRHLRRGVDHVVGALWRREIGGG